MQVEFDTSELARLAKNRNRSVEDLINDYLSEYFTLNPCFMYDVQLSMEDEGVFRCIGCGYWLEEEEMSPYDSCLCVECDEEYRG